LQLHNNLIILDLTNINADNIILLAIDSVLQILDTRLPSTNIPMPSQKNVFYYRKPRTED
jgi:hypothetical protein